MLRKLMVLALLLCLTKLGSDYIAHRKAARGDTGEASQPIYAELNIRVNIDGKPLEEFMLVEAKDRADCDRTREQLEKDFVRSAERVKLPPSIRSSRCLTELTQDQSDLFANRPTNVTYLSLGRSASSEREMRVIAWGLPPAESNYICERLLRAEWVERRRNARCIRSLML